MSDEALLEVLEEARVVGDLGPAELSSHLRNARALAAGVVAPGRFLDLGTGAGVPGLVLALEWPSARVTLLDGSTARIERLHERIGRLGLEGRVEARAARAEEAGHLPEFREQFDLLTARSFGTPATTAECGAGLVAVGGILAVSEPPHSEGQRWNDQALAGLGLAIEGSPNTGWIHLRKVAPTPADRPRRVGVPNKRPLW